MHYKPKPGYSILFNFITLIYLFLYHNVNKEVREQPLGTNCVFPHCGSLILNPGQQAWRQVPSPLRHLSCLLKINNPDQSFPTWEYQNESINIIIFYCCNNNKKIFKTLWLKTKRLVFIHVWSQESELCLMRLVVYCWPTASFCRVWWDHSLPSQHLPTQTSLVMRSAPFQSCLHCTFSLSVVQFPS